MADPPSISIRFRNLSLHSLGGSRTAIPPGRVCLIDILWREIGRSLSKDLLSIPSMAALKKFRVEDQPTTLHIKSMGGALSRPQLPPSEHLMPPIGHDDLQDQLGPCTTLNKKPPREEQDTRYWLRALEEWSPTKNCLMSGKIQEPTPEVLFRERLWVAFCQRVVKNLEAELDAEEWLCVRLTMFQRICQFPTLKESWIARQERKWGIRRDQDWVHHAPNEYKALLTHFADVDLADEFAFMQAGADMHQRFASYHKRVAASHRFLVQRVRAELGSGTVMKRKRPAWKMPTVRSGKRICAGFRSKPSWEM